MTVMIKTLIFTSKEKNAEIDWICLYFSFYYFLPIIQAWVIIPHKNMIKMCKHFKISSFKQSMNIVLIGLQWISLFSIHIFGCLKKANVKLFINTKYVHTEFCHGLLQTAIFSYSTNDLLSRFQYMSVLQVYKL